MIVRNGASLSHRRGGGSSLSINVTGDVVIEAGGSIEVSGRGYWHGLGPGDGAGYEAGGGYGGRGGRGGWQSNFLGGALYGSPFFPTDLGSSGHVGVGGGAVRLVVSGALTVDGSVLANGGNGGAYGSGSGGSIWISAGTLTGVGAIRANGGSSTNYGGGGGGGRIAVYVCEMTFPLDETSVLGGSASYSPQHFGDPGTLFESANTVAILSQPSSQVVCAEGSGAFSIIASDIGSFTLQWQWQPAGAATAWVDLVAGDNAEVGGVPVVHVADVNGDTLGVVPLAGYVDFAPRAFRCVVANACGEVISDEATLTVCAGDFNCDGFVNGLDYDAYAELFEGGEIGADVNNDGFVNGIDYDLFAEHFEAGC
ncbi:MAG: hypothetical protein IT432_16865 [Phycisphaerales bacterium]|nr:hypothetical protein [Phycisphaerales bacterium]